MCIHTKTHHPLKTSLPLGKTWCCNDPKPLPCCSGLTEAVSDVILWWWVDVCGGTMCVFTCVYICVCMYVCLSLNSPHSKVRHYKLHALNAFTSDMSPWVLLTNRSTAETLNICSSLTWTHGYKIPTHFLSLMRTQKHMHSGSSECPPLLSSCLHSDKLAACWSLGKCAS